MKSETAVRSTLRPFFGREDELGDNYLESFLGHELHLVVVEGNDEIGDSSHVNTQAFLWER